MEDGSKKGWQQEKWARAHEQHPDLRLAPTESAGPAGVTCLAGAAAQLEGPAGEAATVSMRRLPDGDVGVWRGHRSLGPSG